MGDLFTKNNNLHNFPPRRVFYGKRPTPPSNIF